MIDSTQFTDYLTEHGYQFVSGVPCSFMKPLINCFENSDNCFYVPAVSEKDAVALSTGFYLGGRNAASVMQNSGLGNIVNPITSLINIYKIPILMFVSLRGDANLSDAIQHSFMGRITDKLLNLIGVENQILDVENDLWKKQLESYFESCQIKNDSHAFIVRKNSFSDCELKQKQNQIVTGKHENIISDNVSKKELTRREAMELLLREMNGSDKIISTTGLTSRDLFGIQNRNSNFYMFGSMGCAMSIACGISIVRPKNRIIVFDGDGATLMNMGAMATVGRYAGPYVHVVFDNGRYQTTGGQRTLSETVNFAKIAEGCGYGFSAEVSKRKDMVSVFNRMSREKIPSLLVVRINENDESKMPRPNISPEDIAQRFRESF